MEWTFVVAMVLAIPVILFPVALVWYLNLGGFGAALREARTRKTRGAPEGKRKAAMEDR